MKINKNTIKEENGRFRMLTMLIKNKTKQIVQNSIRGCVSAIVMMVCSYTSMASDLTVAITSPASGYGQSSSTLTVTGTVSDPTASVTVNGQTATLTESSFTADIALNDGENTVTATAVKDSDTVSTSITVIKDAIAPDVHFGNITDNALIHSSSLIITGTVYDNTDSNPTITIDGSQYATQYNTFETNALTLTEGENTIHWSTSDQFGNSVSGSLTITVDSSAPSVDLSVNSPWNKGSQETLSFTLNDAIGLSSAALKINSRTVWSTTFSETVTSFSHSHSETISPEYPDTAIIELQVEDSAGNVTMESRTIPVVTRQYYYAHVFNDVTGLPFEGSLNTQNTQSKVLRKTASATQESENRIGIISGSTGAVLSVTSPGFTTVVRQIGTYEDGNRVFDIRLTPLSTHNDTLTTAGAQLDYSGLNVTVNVPAAAVSSNTVINITDISSQGLTWFLPLGYSPVRTLNILCDNSTEFSFLQPVTLTLNTIRYTDTSDDIKLVRYNAATHSWDTVTDTITLNNQSTSLTITQAGQYSLVIADGHLLGQNKQSTKTQRVSSDSLPVLALSNPDVSENLLNSKTDPEVLLSGMEQKATGIITLNNGSLMYCSGLALTASSEETYSTHTGSVEAKDPYSQDLILYSYPGNEDGTSELKATFPITPRENLTETPFIQGNIHISFFERVEGTNSTVITPGFDYTLDTENGVQMDISGDQFQTEGYVEIEESLASVSSLISGDDIQIGPSFILTVEDVSFASRPQLSTDWTAEDDETGTYVLTRMLGGTGAGRQQIVSFATKNTDTSRIELNTVHASVLNQYSIESGKYAFIFIPNSIGLVTGQTLMAGMAQPDVLCTLDLSPFGSLTAFDKNFVLPVYAGSENNLTGESISLNAEGKATLTGNTDVQTVDIALEEKELYLTMAIPSTGSLIGTSGATIELNFNNDLDPAQDFNTLVDLGGAAVSTTVRNNVLVVKGTGVLTAGSNVILTITGGSTGIKDIYGGVLPSDLILNYQTQGDGTYTFYFDSVQIEELPKLTGDNYPRLHITIDEGDIPEGSTVSIENPTTLSTVMETISSSQSLDVIIDGFPGDPVQMTVTLPDGLSMTKVMTHCKLMSQTGEKATYYVDSQGGVLKGDGGLEVIIPQGALTSSVNVSLGIHEGADAAQVAAEFPLSQDDVDHNVQVHSMFEISTSKDVELQIPVILKIPANVAPQAGENVVSSLFEYRESVAVPVFDIDKMEPLRNPDGTIKREDSNLRVYKGEVVYLDESQMTKMPSFNKIPNSVSGLQKIHNKLKGLSKSKKPAVHSAVSGKKDTVSEDNVSLAYFLSGMGSLNFSGGVESYTHTFILSGSFKKTTTDTYTDGIIYAGRGYISNHRVAETINGRFMTSEFYAGLPDFVFGVEHGTGNVGLGTQLNSGSYGTTGIGYATYRVGVGDHPFDYETDTAPEFKLSYRVLNSDNEEDKEGQSAFENTETLPMGDLLEVKIFNIVDDKGEDTVDIIVESNGKSYPVTQSADGRFAVISPDTMGSYVLKVKAIDSAHNETVETKHFLYGTTGGEYLPGPPKIIENACYPKTGTLNIPVYADPLILFSEPVNVNTPSNAFLLFEREGDGYIPAENITVDVEPIGEVDGFASTMILHFSNNLKFNKKYKLVIQKVMDNPEGNDGIEALELDQNYIPGSGDTEPTPAEIIFNSSDISDSLLETESSAMSDVAFIDNYAFAGVAKFSGQTPNHGIEMYKTNDEGPGKILHRIDMHNLIRPRALDVIKTQKPITDEDGRILGYKDVYLLAVAAFPSNHKITNGVILLYEVEKNGVVFVDKMVGVSVLYLMETGYSSSYHIKMKGDKIFCGIAKGSYNDSDGVTPCGIKVFSIQQMKDHFDELSLPYALKTFRYPHGQIDFIETPGFCWDIGVYTNQKNQAETSAVAADGSYTKELVGINATQIGDKTPEMIEDGNLTFDARVKLRHTFSNQAPYMIEVKEHVYYKDSQGDTKEITLGFLRANSTDGTSNKAFLLDITDINNQFNVLSKIEFDYDDQILSVFLDQVQDIAAITFRGGVSRFYRISDPLHPEMFYETGTGDNPAFSLAGINDGLAFGSDGKLKVLNFNPDMFKYYGYRGVVLSQYDDITQSEQYRPNLDYTVYTDYSNTEEEPKAVDGKIYLRYELNDRAFVSLKLREVDEDGQDVSWSQDKVLKEEALVFANTLKKETMKLSELFESETKFHAYFGRVKQMAPRYYRYTLEARPENAGVSQTIKKTGVITLNKHIRALEPWDMLDNGVHTYHGNLIVSRTDLALPAPELPLIIRRTYTNLGQKDSGYGPSGSGWRYNLFPSITRVSEDYYQISFGDYTGITFKKEGSTYKPENGYSGELSKNEEKGTYTYTSKEGIKYFFKPIDKLSSGDNNALETEDEIPFFLDPYNGKITNTAPNIDFIEGPGTHKIQFDYNEDTGRLEKITDILGREVKLNYEYKSGAYRINEIRQEQATIITNTYNDLTGDLEKVDIKKGSDIDNNTSYTEHYTYFTDEEKMHNLKSIKDFDNNETFYTYEIQKDDFLTDGDGNKLVTEEWVKTISYPEGRTVTVAIEDVNEERHSSFTTTGGGTLATGYQFGIKGELTSQTTPLGETTYENYDTENCRPGKITAPDGTFITLTYDDRHNIASKSTSRNNGTISETYSYNTKNRITKTTGPEGTREYTYDITGWKLEEETLNEVTVASYTQNTYGQPETVTDHMGFVTTYIYDSNQLPKTIQKGTAEKITLKHNILGHLTHEESDRGLDIAYDVDVLGNIHKKTEMDTEQIVTDYTLNGNGQVTKEECTSTGHSITWEYDGLGRMTKETVKPGNDSQDTQETSNITYNVFGNRLSADLPNGESETLTYDTAGRLNTRTIGNTLVTEYTYASGKTVPLTMTDKLSGKKETYEYNKFGQVKKKTFTDETETGNQNSETFTYNLKGLLVNHTDINGVSTTYEYNDSLNRMTNITKGNGLESISITYAEGNQKDIENLTTGIKAVQSYNALNELISEDIIAGYETRKKTINYLNKGKSFVKTTTLGNGIVQQQEISGTGKVLSDKLGDVVTQYKYYNGGLTTTKTIQPKNENDILRTETIKTDIMGNPLEFNDSNGNKTTLTYNSTAKTITKTDSSGTTTIATDKFGRTGAITKGDTLIEKHIYDDENNIETIHNRGGRITHITRDSFGRNTKVHKTELERYETVNIDYTGLVTTQTKTGTINSVTVEELDALYRPLRISTPETESNFTYTDNGGKLLTETSGTRTITRKFNSFGELEELKVNGVPTLTVDYDYKNRIQKHKVLTNVTTTYTKYFDASGHLQIEQTALGTTLYTTNSLGEPLTLQTDKAETNSKTGAGMESQQALTYSYLYDGNGNITSYTNPKNVTTTLAYDSFDRPETLTQPGGYQSTFSYDALNRLLSVSTSGDTQNVTITHPSQNEEVVSYAGQSTKITKNSLGQPVVIERSDGKVMTMAYDFSGNRAYQKHYDGREQIVTYDSEGRPVKEETGDGHIKEYEYDTNGNLIKATTDGQIVNLYYDDNGRLIKREFENGLSVQYGYYPGGQIERVVDSQGDVTRYFYNEAGKISRLTDVGNRSIVENSYDEMGRKITEKHYENGVFTGTTHTMYDRAGNITEHRYEDNSGTELYKETYEYDVRNNVMKKTESRSGAVYETAYTYYKSDLLKSYEVKNEGGTLLEKVTYTHDAAGNRLTEVHEGNDPKTIENTFNNINQLMSSQITNDQSQITSVSYTYDDAGRLLSFQKSETGNQNPAVTTCTYDEWGNLQTVTTPEGETSYRYTFDGRRISKISGGNIINYSWDNENILEITSENSGRINKYIYSDNKVVGKINNLNRQQTVITDRQNSVTDVLEDNAIQQSYRYTPYGEISTDNLTDTEDITYLSMPYDRESGTSYLLTRQYSQKTGTFTTPDKFNYINKLMPYTMNLYQYSYSNPMKWTDRTGMTPVEATDGNEYYVPHEEAARYHKGNNGHVFQIKDENGIIQHVYMTRREMNKPIHNMLKIFEEKYLQTAYGQERAYTISDYLDIAGISVGVIAAAGIALPVIYYLSESYLADTLLGKVATKLAQHYMSWKPWVAGTMGAAFEYGKQSIFYNNNGWTDRDWTDVGVSFAASSLTFGWNVGKVGSALIAGGTNVAEGFLQAHVGSDRREYGGWNLVMDFGLGIGFSYIADTIGVKVFNYYDEKVNSFTSGLYKRYFGRYEYWSGVLDYAVRKRKPMSGIHNIMSYKAKYWKRMNRINFANKGIWKPFIYEQNDLYLQIFKESEALVPRLEFANQ